MAKRAPIVKVTFEAQDGNTYTVDNAEDVRAVVSSMPHNIKFKTSTQLEVLRKKYHAMLSAYAKDTNKGYTKASLHEAMKPLIMKKFIDFPHYFTHGKPEYSTKHLTLEGWQAMIDNLRETALFVDNYTFKQTNDS